MKDLLQNKDMCCGCGVCELVCPSKCIYFEKDVIGAEYPSVNQTECIKCGACEKVCPMQKDFSKNQIGKEVFAAYSNDPGIRFRGSSGGMFETISKKIIELGGSVFASKFDSKMHLKFFEAKTLSEVQEMTKSKYVQSKCIDVFPLVKQRIVDHKTVLFCGTPCQVEALKNFLGVFSTWNSLYLADFFCHGVPPQSLFDMCRKYVEKKKHIQILDYQFRAKKHNGATPHYLKVKYETEGGIIKNKMMLYLKDPYYLGFQKYITLRDSCYDCPYGSGNHAADITLGDFHEIEKYVPEINRFDGVSTVIINTDKGKRIWDSISDQITVHSLSLDVLLRDKTIYFGGTPIPNERDAFLKDMKQLDFEFVVKKWFDCKKEIIKEIYYFLPANIRKLIKKILH